MKKTRAILAVIMIMTAVFTLSVYRADGGSPSQTVEQDIEAFKHRIPENGIDEVFGLEILAAVSPEDMDLLSEKIGEFDYEILKEKAEGDTASVTVKVTTYEFGSEVQKVIRGIFFDGIFSAFSDSESIRKEEIAEILRERLGGLEKKKYSKKVEIDCRKENGEWVSDLENNERFLDAASGGVVSVIRKYERYF